MSYENDQNPLIIPFMNAYGIISAITAAKFSTNCETNQVLDFGTFPMTIKVIEHGIGPSQDFECACVAYLQFSPAGWKVKIKSYEKLEIERSGVTVLTEDRLKRVLDDLIEEIQVILSRAVNSKAA